MSLANEIHDKLVDQMKNVLTNAVLDAMLKEPPDLDALDEAVNRYGIGLVKAREIREMLMDKLDECG